MAHPPTPPYGAVPPPPDPGRPPRRRPHKAWFAVGPLLLLAAVGCVVHGVLALVDTTRADAVLSTRGGQPVAVALDDLDRRMLFVPLGVTPPRCTVTPGGAVGPVSGRAEVGSGGEQWVAFAQFTPTDDRVEVACSSEQVVRVRVGPALDVGGFVAPLLIAIVGSIVLGGLGIVALVVTAALYASGRPR